MTAIATGIGLLSLLPYAENAARTVAELRALCTPQTPAAVATSVPARVVAQDGEVLIEDSQSITPNAAMVRAQMEYGDMNDYFFQPYKKNYITFGSLKNADGSAPFSGESLDIKFELGMQFTLFPEIDSFTALASPDEYAHPAAVGES